MYYFLSFFSFIGLGYFAVWCTAYYYRKQNKTGESELALLVSNRLFVISFLFLYLYSIFENWYSFGNSYFYEMFAFYNRALGLWFFVFILYLFLPLFLFFKPMAKNAIVSLFFGLFLFYEDVSVVFPDINIFNKQIVSYLLRYSCDRLPSDLINDPISIIIIIRDSFIFFIIWFIFFRFLKKRISQKELSISDHLIEN